MNLRKNKQDELKHFFGKLLDLFLNMWILSHKKVSSIL